VSIADRPPGLGWALVGPGRHARRFLAPAIRSSSTGSLAAVCGHDPARTRQFADEFDVPAHYITLDDALADPNVDAVLIATPNYLHSQQVSAAAAAGKHVLCEKPLATAAAECLTLLDSCVRAGVRLAVGFHLRCNPIHAAAREAIARGELGELHFAEVQYMHATGGPAAVPSAAWRTDPEFNGGGAFMGNGVHAIDLLRFLTGQEVTRVWAVQDGRSRLRCERLAVCTAQLSAGLLATVSAGTSPFPVNQVAIQGSRGTLRCKGSIGYYGRGTLEIVDATGTRTLRRPESDVYLRQCDAFARSVADGAHPDAGILAGGADGLRCAEVVDAAYASLECGGPVTVDPRTPVTNPALES
jgi:1,5-anhydro-D-fructose reductase (1,5-anhydro-D-mannitol-forming)